MTLDILEHCTKIINSSRIRNKIVLLCEGEVKGLQGRPSPITYKELEKMPDSSFYKASIPTWWTQNRPRFFNCGDRNNVIDTYFTLLELHNDSHSKGISSNLDPNKLFALVDLDIQKKKIDGYNFSDTEKIFHSLYHKIKVNEANTLKHRIWVTGLVHKEAYFIVPGLQTVFDNFKAIYNNRPLCLEDIYLAMANEITSDVDLTSFFKTARIRIEHCLSLDLTDVTNLENSWKTEFNIANDNVIKNELIFSLLTIRKAKKHWQQIKPSSDWTGDDSAFKDQILLEIGKFYSNTEELDTAQYHIPSFFNTLYKFV